MVSEEEIKIALGNVIGIRKEDWLSTHDEIFKGFDKVKEDYYDLEKDEPKNPDGIAIQTSSKFAKKYFGIIQRNFQEDYSIFFGGQGLKETIELIGQGMKRERIESICRHRACEMEEEQSLNITEKNEYLYFMAAVITWESLKNQAFE